MKWTYVLVCGIHKHVLMHLPKSSFRWPKKKKKKLSYFVEEKNTTKKSITWSIKYNIQGMQWIKKRKKKFVHVSFSFHSSVGFIQINFFSSLFLILLFVFVSFSHSLYFCSQRRRKMALKKTVTICLSLHHRVDDRFGCGLGFVFQTENTENSIKNWWETDAMTFEKYK